MFDVLSILQSVCDDACMKITKVLSALEAEQ